MKITVTAEDIKKAHKTMALGEAWNEITTSPLPRVTLPLSKARRKPAMAALERRPIDEWCSRANDGKKTIITTNRTPDELKAWLGERLADRLRGGMLHSSADKSLRGRAA